LARRRHASGLKIGEAGLLEGVEVGGDGLAFTFYAVLFGEVFDDGDQGRGAAGSAPVTVTGAGSP
jgi:hypothetical protein